MWGRKPTNKNSLICSAFGLGTHPWHVVAWETTHSTFRRNVLVLHRRTPLENFNLGDVVWVSIIPYMISAHPNAWTIWLEEISCWLVEIHIPQVPKLFGQQPTIILCNEVLIHWTSFVVKVSWDKAIYKGETRASWVGYWLNPISTQIVCL